MNQSMKERTAEKKGGAASPVTIPRKSNLLLNYNTQISNIHDNTDYRQE